MRRLLNTFDHGEMLELTQFLEDRGILIRAHFVGANHYPNEWAIDVCLDHQFDDAVALLRDSDHQVTTPVDTSEIHHELSVSAGQSERYSLRFFVVVAVASLVVACALGYYSVAA